MPEKQKSPAYMRGKEGRPAALGDGLPSLVPVSDLRSPNQQARR